MFSFKEISENPSLDISSNFQFGKDFKIYARDLYKLWNCGIGLIGIKHPTIGTEGKLVFVDKEGKLYTSGIKDFEFWKSVLKTVSSNDVQTVLGRLLSLAGNKLSRIYSSWDTCPLCCISASRDGKTESENNKRTESLYNDLSKIKVKGKPAFSIVPIVGYYQESGRKQGSEEKSFLILARKGTDAKKFNDLMGKLGNKYEQDSVLLRNPGQDTAHYLYTSNTKEHKKGDTLDLGRFLPNRLTGYVSKFVKKGRKGSFGFRHPMYDTDVKEYRDFTPSEPSEWVRIEPNIYAPKDSKYNTKDKKGSSFYKVTVVHNGKRYTKIVNTLPEARSFRKKIKSM